jgi:type VI secretion system protein ImpK
MQDDDLSKTMFIPNPGGRRKSATAFTSEPGGSYSEAQSHSSPVNLNVSAQSAGENLLLSAASELLIFASNIRSLEPNNSIEQLRSDVEMLISTFDQQINNANLSKEVALTARYLICCLLDELVLSTPWGTDSVWSHQTLLSKYHRETSGGEKFFLIVDKLLEQPQRSIDLIELCYVCLSSGFCGKYRVSKQGESELLRIGQSLCQPIDQIRPIARDLSPSWQGVGKVKTNFVKQFPPILMFLILGCVLAAVYITFLTNLKTKSEPLYEKVESIGWHDLGSKVSDNTAQSPDINVIATSLKNLFRSYIEQKILTIDIQENRLVIRFVSTSLFESGSSFVNMAALPDVNILANGIKNYVTRVSVVGHTDSTGKPASNWVISRKRAEAIAQWLATSNVPLGNIKTRGVADKQPLVSNDNAYNQSINRRVELILVLRDNV